ncbi:MAG: DUF1648 domain-containing protein [Lachnospiraceae bacterium]|nr:DUF1648 domain-containing protein [Lachnospiraceae bacterium]
MSKTVNLLFKISMLLPLIVTLICFPFVPDMIPAHYNRLGEITRYGSKFELFLLPIVTIAFGLFMIGVCQFSTKEIKKPFLYWIYGICFIPMIIFNGITYHFLFSCL